MLKDIVVHNRRMLKKREKAYEHDVEEQKTNEGGFLFFDSEHPILSLFASWLSNK